MAEYSDAWFRLHPFGVTEKSVLNFLRNLQNFILAGMAELADAHGSGPCESNFMQVQVLLPAPYFKGVPFGTPLKYFYTSKRITGLEAER